MTGINHVRAGVIMAVATPIIYGIEPDMVITVSSMCILGSMFPDLDMPSSGISKCVPLIPTFFNKVFGHRKLIHSPVFLVGIDLLLYYLLNMCMSEYTVFCIMLGFTTGFIVHLVLDAFTVGGAPILYPLMQKNIHFTKRKSGEKGEEWVMFACTLAIMIIWLLTCGRFVFKIVW